MSVGGKVESGYVATGDNVLVAPGQEIGVVKSIRCGEETVPFIGAGDNGELVLQGVDIAHVTAGVVRKLIVGCWLLVVTFILFFGYVSYPTFKTCLRMDCL